MPVYVSRGQESELDVITSKLQKMSLSPLELKLPPGTPNSVKHYWASRTTLSINVVHADSQCLALWSGGGVWSSVIYVGCGAPKVSPGVVNACQTASLARQPPYP